MKSRMQEYLGLLHMEAEVGVNQLQSLEERGKGLLRYDCEYCTLLGIAYDNFVKDFCQRPFYNPVVI